MLKRKKGDLMILFKEEKMERENMTREQEIEHVNDWFDKYEKEGFSKVFISPYEPNEEINRQGTPFKVIGRIKPITETENGNDTADLESLPLWKIEFEDKHTIIAYPEEIIPSEIRANIQRESDKKYLELM